MTLILETGAGLSNSNAYADAETALAYWADRGVAEWAEATEAAQEYALIRATDYIDASYVFRSVKLDDDQALENPRYGQDALAAPLVKATIELALHMLTVDAFAPVTERDVQAESQSLEGVGSTSKTYADRRVADQFPKVTAILKSIASVRGLSGGTMWLSQ